MVHEARPDAGLNRLHLSICAGIAAKVICWLVEVHACGVRVWWIEGIGWQRLLLLVELLCKWRWWLLVLLLTEV